MAEDSKCRAHDVAGGMTRVVRGHAPWLYWTAFVVSVLTIPWQVASPQSLPPFGQECLFGAEGPRAGVKRARLLIGEDERLGGFVLHVVAPVRLHEHGVDLLEIYGLGLVAHRFYQGSDTEVFDGPQGAFGDAQDEIDGLISGLRPTGSGGGATLTEEPAK